jgi:hypothetical protein
MKTGSAENGQTSSSKNLHIPRSVVSCDLMEGHPHAGPFLSGAHFRLVVSDFIEEGRVQEIFVVAAFHQPVMLKSEDSAGGVSATRRQPLEAASG